LVPLVFERCDIPGNLSLYHKLPYDPTNHKHKWFWDKLVKTLHPQGAFDSSIKMLDMEPAGLEVSGSNTVSSPSAPVAQKSKEGTPTTIPEKQPKKLPPASPPILKPTPASTPPKNTKSKGTLPSKISSLFTSKSSKSKKNSEADPPFRNLCEEPASPSTECVPSKEAMEEEEEGVNESGELLLPTVPTHEPGLIERVRGRVGGARRKYGSKQAESLA